MMLVRDQYIAMLVVVALVSIGAYALITGLAVSEDGRIGLPEGSKFPVKKITTPLDTKEPEDNKIQPSKIKTPRSSTRSKALDIPSAGGFSILAQATNVSTCTTILSPGDYELNTSISTAIGDCINIGTNDLVLDCNGFNITGVGTDIGIYTDTTNVTIKNCNISGFANGIYLDYAEEVTIIDNNLTNMTNSGIYLHDTVEILIEDNLIENSNGSGIKSFNTGATNTNITGNTIVNITPGQETDSGIYVYLGAYYLIENNTIVNVTNGSATSFSGIYAIRTDNSTITSNNISYVGYGIKLNPGASTGRPPYHENVNISFNIIANPDPNVNESLGLNLDPLPPPIILYDGTYNFNQVFNNIVDAYAICYYQDDAFSDISVYNNTFLNCGTNINLAGSSPKGNFTNEDTIIFNGTTNLTDEITFDNTSVIVLGDLNVSEGSSFVYRNSKDSVIVFGDLIIAGNYTLDNSTLKMAKNVSISIINVTSTGRMDIGNDSLVTMNETDDYRFYVQGEIEIDNSTVEYTDTGLIINSDENNFTDSTFRNSYVGLYINNSLNHSINNNLIFNNTGQGILAINSSNNSILNNNISFNGDSGMEIGSISLNNTIANNNITYNDDTGIEFYYSVGSPTDNLVVNNTISDNADDGVSLWSIVENNTIMNNFIYNQTDNGISVIGSDNNNFTGNDVRFNGGSGISFDSYFAAHPGNNTITDNILDSNGNGIFLRRASDNIIENNTMRFNGYTGITLSVVTANNTFIDNIVLNNSLNDFSSSSSTVNNTIQNLTIGETVTNLTFSGGLFIDSADGTGLADPSGFSNLGHYVNITNTTSSPNIFVNVSYAEGDRWKVNDESTMRLYKNTGGVWSNTTLGTLTNGVDTSVNYVYANITNFSSIFAPMGVIEQIFACTNLTLAGGYYELGANLAGTQPNGICIDVQESNITFNCVGFDISGSGNGTAINVENVNNSEIEDCVITNYAFGINLTNSSGNILTNTTANNNLIGLVLNDSSNNFVIDSTFVDNSDDDFVAFGASGNNTMTGLTTTEPTIETPTTFKDNFGGTYGGLQTGVSVTPYIDALKIRLDKFFGGTSVDFPNFWGTDLRINTLKLKTNVNLRDIFIQESEFNNLPMPSDDTYKLFSFTSNLKNSEIDTVYYGYRTTGTWVESTELDPLFIRLYAYDEGWKLLSSNIIGPGSDNFVYYQATDDKIYDYYAIAEGELDYSEIINILGLYYSVKVELVDVLDTISLYYENK